MCHKCPICGKACVDEILAVCCCMEKSYYCGTCSTLHNTYDQATGCCALLPVISYHCPVCSTEYRAKMDAVACHSNVNTTY